MILEDSLLSIDNTEEKSIDDAPTNGDSIYMHISEFSINSNNICDDEFPNVNATEQGKAGTTTDDTPINNASGMSTMTLPASTVNLMTCSKTIARNMAEKKASKLIVRQLPKDDQY